MASRNTAYRQKIRKFILEYKLKHPCVDCGEIDPIVLDFDHRDPKTKLFGLSDAIIKGMPYTIREIEKCDIRCANCHRRKTYYERLK